MATYGQTLRRGLPRRSGGDAWPPAGAAPVGAPAEGDAAGASAEAAAVNAAAPDATAAAASAPTVQTAASAPAAAAEAAAATAVQGAETVAFSTPAPAEPAAAKPARGIRRGLPRVPGGEPWPPADAVAAPTSVLGAAEGAASTAPEAAAASPAVPASAATDSAGAGAATAAAASTAPAAEAGPAASPGEAITVRRGLPRTPGGDPWPPADYSAAKPSASAPEESAPAAPADSAPAASASSDAAAAPTEVVVEEAGAPAETVLVPAASGADVSQPLPFTRTVFPGASTRTYAPAPEPQRIGPFTRVQWAGATIIGGITLLLLAGMAVAAVRFILSLPPLQDFLATYPGEYHLPEGAPVGIPAWLGWQHFFNVFLIVLIIRSGLQVRTEKRPTAFWSPRTNSKRKISLALWFHQSLDILWIVNGVVFVVLLFVTGQWMRIIPTSWEVFPNALSAALQYVSLDWPTENGWVNYNSLQQLAYFATVFVAAPLAIITGVRMSGVWPKNAKTLNRLYPVEWARAVHFPTMIYFVVFIFFHVVLVFATGALRNLNHMYAAQGSVDPDAYADNWVGFWIFVGSLFVIAAAWVAARPLVLAPIARLFGNVSSR